jgi:pyruvate/2-oxoglutarate dehydrogenase complex dihydrolipoamide acyltransferase (E2) component
VPDFKLPDLGEGVTEGEIDKWLVKEGDVVQEDDLIVEIITDKATAEIPSPWAGVVAKIHHAEGEIVPVGNVLITIGEDTPETSPSLGGPEKTSMPATVLAAGDPPPVSPGDSADQTDDGPVKAMPPVRKLARDLGVDIGTVSGSGPGGRILRPDVERMAAQGQQPAIAATAQAPAREAIPAGGQRIPLRGIRRTIAERMAEAHRLVPPVTHVEECDVTELDATRRLANERNPRDTKLTVLPFIVKAVVAGLKDHPILNSSLDEDAREIVVHDRYDIGVAVDTPSGLVVPVVRDADHKRVAEIAEDIDRLARGARDGSLKPDELRGSTFTVTSPGPFGGLMATPIVFHPQAAILGVHRASERAVVRDGQIVARLMMNLSLTFDHRILDGMAGAKFVLDVVKLLEHPAVLALES